MSGPVFLLFTSGERGLASRLATDIGTGVHGTSIRRVDVKGVGADLRLSATRAVNEAARILYREQYLDRQLVVQFSADHFDNVHSSNIHSSNIHGRSAELAFALAFVAAAVERELPAMAATGIVGEGGVIERIDGLAGKFSAALSVLPDGGTFVFPAANESELADEQRHRAAEQKVTLLPAHRLEEMLARLGLPITRTWLAEPFRGLEPFRFEHASIFFGRETETAELLALLKRRPAVLVRGPSGAGKSSVVLAGVLPGLLRRRADSLHWGLLRPHDIERDGDVGTEHANMVRALIDAWRHDEEGGAGSVPVDGPLPQSATALIEWLRARGGAQSLLVIDQLEDLFESRLHPATVEALAEFLAELNQDSVKLIATMTNAALPALAQIPALANCFRIEGQYVLEPRHDAAMLETVIRAPAAAAGLSYETGLEAALVGSASHGGTDVLPLLELLLTELYERRDRATNELRVADYKTVGGLDGVTSARAEAVYGELTASERNEVPLLLWKLNTLGVVETKDYPETHPIHAVLVAYQRRRLLVRDHDGKATVLRAAHEALLRHWSRAVDERRTHADAIALWRDLMREAVQSGRGERALIPAGPQFAAASALLRERQKWWTAGDAPMVDYVKRSMAQSNRRQVIVRLALGLPATAATFAGVWWLWNAWRARFETQIDFGDISVPGPDYVVAAEAYLRRLGIVVTARVPDSARIIITSSLGLYQGRATEAGKTEHFLTLTVESGTEPVSFTLAFDKPPRRVGLTRARLWAATQSGVTHPQWTAEAIDMSGTVIDKVEEELVRSFTTVPGKQFMLVDRDKGPIAAVRITSDYRLLNREGRLVPFAAFRAMLLNELVLYY